MIGAHTSVGIYQGKMLCAIHTRHDGGSERCVEVVVDRAEEARQQPVISHGVDHPGQRKHGACTREMQ